MTNRQPCPDHESLIQFSRGDLGGEPLVTLCDHVDSCPACQNLLDTIADSSTALTRQFVGINDHDLERSREAIEADLPTVQAVACSMSEMPPTATSNQGPTLSPPCELRQYHVMRLIAHGGMGEIYEAAHASLKRPVALKVIRRNRLDDPVTHRCFLQEIEVSGQLDHPNLVRAYDAWEQDGCLFLVQELLDGESLQTLARRGQFTTPSSLLNVLIPICCGVEALHARGLLHRDIKPANVMQLRNGTIKLVDFGLAIRPDTGGIAAHSRVGTIGYMSPEQARGGTTVDERSDLFAVGCVVKDLLGQLPTHSWDQSEAQILQSLVNLTRQLLEENPDHRPQSVSEILRQLEHLPKPSPTSLGSGTSPSIATGSQTDLVTSSRANPGRRRVRLMMVLGGVLGGLGMGLWWLLSNTAAQRFDPIDAVAVATSRLDWESPPPTEDSSAAKASGDVKPVRQPLLLRLVDIPAGEFAMGGAVNDPKLMAIEIPQRTIRFPHPFRISAHEVTVRQFRIFAEETGYVTEAVESGTGGWLAARNTTFSKRDPSYRWDNPGHELADELPVTMVTYRDALVFCDWLSQREAKPFRLPTEAEWEYCCRAGESGVYYFPIQRSNDYAWTLRNLGDHLTPRPVGTRQPNAWGLFDMVGNVREWCLDWYSPTAYENNPIQFPAGPPEGRQRVVRGACFMDDTLFLRSSNRGYMDPTNACQNQGFRVVQSDTPETQFLPQTPAKD